MVDLGARGRRWEPFEDRMVVDESERCVDLVGSGEELVGLYARESVLGQSQ